MCTVLLPPVVKPIEVNKYIKGIKDTVLRGVIFVSLNVVSYNSSGRYTTILNDTVPLQ